MLISKRVVVIGGGVVGLCAAYYAQKLGHVVTILERGGAEYDCCSLGNAGMVVPSHFTPLAAPGMISYALKLLPNPEGPFAIKPNFDSEFIRWCLLFAKSSTQNKVRRSEPLLRDLNVSSRCAYEELSDDLGGDFGLELRGLMTLVRTAKALHEEAETVKRANDLGVPAELLSASDVARLDPGIDMDVVGGVYFSKDAHLTPHHLIPELRRATTAGGAKFISDTTVTGFATSSGKVDRVLSTAGDFGGDEFIVAAGSWTSKLVKSLGIDLPLQPGKGYSMTIPAPRQVPKICSVLAEARLAVTPMGSSLRVGGTMEIGQFDQSVNVRRVDGIRKSFVKYFPKFEVEDFDGVPVWNGLRPCSPDGLPYVGRFNQYHNLIAATGHAMMGVSLGPITGQIVGSLLSGDSDRFEMGLLSPDRFRRN